MDSPTVPPFQEKKENLFIMGLVEQAGTEFDGLLHLELSVAQVLSIESHRHRQALVNFDIN